MPTEAILEFDNATDEIIANPETPSIVRERLPSIDAHDVKAEATRISNIRSAYKIREERSEIARMIDEIERADVRVGPLMRERTNEKGITEKVPVDRLSPLKDKDVVLRTRLNEVSAARSSPKIGEPVRKYLTTMRNRTLTAADPVSVEVKKGETITEAYERFQAKADAKRAKIEDIWNTPRPLAEVLEQIPRQVDKIAHAPRLGELFAGSYTTSHLGKRKIDYPNPKILFELERVRQDPLFGESFGTVTSATALVAWLFRDEMIEKLSAMAGARATGRKSMSAEAKRDALDAAYLELETALRIEVAAGFAVEETTGGIVDFRPVHPAIFLGLAADPAAIAGWGDR